MHLEALHETATDWHEASLIDLHQMRKYEALCLAPVPDYSPLEIRELRARYNLSQAVLAAVLNTNASTVRQWEIGGKHPSGPSLNCWIF